MTSSAFKMNGTSKIPWMVYIALAVHFGGFIWGIATMHQRQVYVEEQLIALTKTIYTRNEALINLKLRDTKIDSIEKTVNRLEDKIDTLFKYRPPFLREGE